MPRSSSGDSVVAAVRHEIHNKKQEKRKTLSDFQAKASGSSNRVMEQKTKVRDVHTAEADRADKAHLAYGQGGDEDMMGKDILRCFTESCDEDATYISEFEDAIVDAVQESSLAPVLQVVKRQEPVSGRRQRPEDIGQLAPAKALKGRGKGKRDFAKGSSGRSQTLADRIANSSCRLCGKKGHCKRECSIAQNQNKENSRTETSELCTGLSRLGRRGLHFRALRDPRADAHGPRRRRPVHM